MKIHLNSGAESSFKKLEKSAHQKLSKNQLERLVIREHTPGCIVHICQSCNAVLYAMIEDFYCGYTDSYYSIRQNDRTIIEKFLHEDYSFDEVYKEIGKQEKMTHCPICDSKLNKQIPFVLSTASRSSLPNNFRDYDESIIIKYSPNRRLPRYDDIDTLSNIMLGIIRDSEVPVSKNDADMFSKSCDISQPNQAPNDSLKNSVENLKNYIFNLINLESNIVSLTKRLGQLYYERTQNTKEVRFQRNYPLYGLKLKLQDKKTLLENSQKELTALEKKKVKPEIVYYPTAPTKPILKTPNFFNKKRVTLENEQLMAKYEKELGRYNEKVEQCNKQEKENIEKARKEKEAAISKAKTTMEKYRSEVDSIKKEINEKAKSSDTLPIPAIGVKHLLDSEISITEETLRKLYNCRNQLYSYNIIFDKYRNLVALSSFYEYLMAGRCETLEGANGAYNIYESEIRMDQIISQLDEVIVSLDQIKKNQYMIYQKLEEMNFSLCNLESSMKKVTVSLDEIKVNTNNMNKYLDSIEKNTAVIAHNSAVTAYYSKVNAELTNALGFMVALK